MNEYIFDKYTLLSSYKNQYLNQLNHKVEKRFVNNFLLQRIDKINLLYTSDDQRGSLKKYS